MSRFALSDLLAAGAVPDDGPALDAPDLAPDFSADAAPASPGRTPRVRLSDLLAAGARPERPSPQPSPAPYGADYTPLPTRFVSGQNLPYEAPGQEDVNRGLSADEILTGNRDFEAGQRAGTEEARARGNVIQDLQDADLLTGSAKLDRLRYIASYGRGAGVDARAHPEFRRMVSEGMAEAAQERNQQAYIGEHLIGKKLAQVGAAGSAIVASGARMAGELGRRIMPLPAQPQVEGGSGGQSMFQGIARQAETGAKRWAGDVQNIEENLPQTTAGAIATGAADLAMKFAAGAVGGPGAAMTAFATDAAAEAGTQAVQRGASPDEATKDAFWMGLKGALLARIPMAQHDARVMTQLQQALVVGAAQGGGDQAVGVAYQKFVNGRPVTEADVDSIAHGFLMGGVLGPAIHGAVLGAGRLAQGRATPASVARPTEAPGSPAEVHQPGAPENGADPRFQANNAHDDAGQVPQSPTPSPPPSPPPSPTPAPMLPGESWDAYAARTGGRPDAAGRVAPSPAPAPEPEAPPSPPLSPREAMLEKLRGASKRGAAREPAAQAVTPAPEPSPQPSPEYRPALPEPPDRVPAQYDPRDLRDALPRRRPAERIAMAATRDGQTGKVYEGQHHGESFDAMMADAGVSGSSLGTLDGRAEHGFTTTDGRFVTRDEAAAIAKSGGQFRPKNVLSDGRESTEINLSGAADPERYRAQRQSYEDRLLGGNGAPTPAPDSLAPPPPAGSPRPPATPPTGEARAPAQATPPAGEGGAPKNLGQRIVEAGKAELADLRAAKAKRAAGNKGKRSGSAQGPFDPQEWPIIAKIGAGHVLDGAIKLAEFSRRMVEAVPELAMLGKSKMEALFAKSQSLASALHDPEYKGPEEPPAEAPTPPIRPPAESAGGDKLISVKNAHVATERAAAGMPERPPVGRQGFDAVWDEAKRRVADNPRAAEAVVARLKADPHAPLDAVEQDLLVHRKLDLGREQHRLAKAAVDATEAGDPIAAQAHRLALAGAEAQYREILELGEHVGTTSARALANRRKWVDAETYDLAHMKAKEEIARGRPLTDEERTSVTDLQRQIAEAAKAHAEALAGAEKKAADLQSQLDHERKVREIGAPAAPAPATPEAKPGRRRYGSTNRVVTADAYAKALADLKSATFSVGGALPVAVKVAAFHIEAGARSFGEFTAKMIADVGERIRPHLERLYAQGTAAVGEARRKDLLEGIKGRLADGDDPAALGRWVSELHKTVVAEQLAKDGKSTRDGSLERVHEIVKDVMPEGWSKSDTRDAMSGYGKSSQPSQDEVSRRVRQERAELQDVAKLEGLAKAPPEAPLRTGPQRDKPGDEKRALSKKVSDEMKRLGITVTDPETHLAGVLDGIKSRLRNEIADMDFAIASGTRPARAEGGVAYDTEATDLRAARDAKKKEFDALFPKEPPSPAEQLDRAMRLAEGQARAADKALADAKANGFKRATGQRMTSPEIEAVRARADAARAELTALRDADSGLAEERRVKALAKALELVTTGATRAKDAPAQGPDSARVAALRAQLDAAREARKAAGRKTPEEIALAAAIAAKLRTIADYADRTARGDFGARPKAAPSLAAADPAVVRLGSIAAEAKKRWEQRQAQLSLAARPLWEKGLDFAKKWSRMAALTWPTTVLKLTGAATNHMLLSPLESALSKGMSYVPGLSAIADRAPRWGGRALAAEGRAFARGVTRGMKDAWENLKGKESELDLLHGDHDHEPPGWMEYAGKLHAALKSIPKRAEFERSLAARAAHAAAHGADVADPAVQARLMADAYADANESIFMNDNFVSKMVESALAMGERRDPATDKIKSVGGKVAATVGHVLLPVKTVPTNIVARVFQYAGGSVSGSLLAARAFVKGVGTLGPAEADQVMRHLVRGSLGASVALLAFLRPDAFGGVYRPGKRREEGELAPGDIDAGGVRIPHQLAHAPLFELANVFATMRQVMDESPRHKDPETGRMVREQNGASDGALAALTGLVRGVPFVREGEEVKKVLVGPGQVDAAKKIGINAAVPGAVQWSWKQFHPPAEKVKAAGRR